jgi:putative monooxygenase ydhR
MQTLIITFRLDGLDAAAYAQAAEEMAPQFAAVPGLIGKTWLADPETNTYGGVYFFAERRSVDDYLASAIVQALHANPHLADVTARVYGTLEAPTRITWGAQPVASAA